MIQAIIFDLDGTLANTEELHFRAWRETLLNNGVEEFTFDQFMAYVGTSNEKVAGDFISSHQIAKTVTELVKEKQQCYMKRTPEVKLFDGALELIDRFYSQYSLAVASSSHQPEIHAILRHHNIFDKMTVIYGGDMVTEKKPHPEIYLKTAEALHLAPASCLAFEDSNPGITAAKAAGMYAIAVPNAFTQAHDFSPADLVIESFDDVRQQTLKQLTTGS